MPFLAVFLKHHPESPLSFAGARSDWFTVQYCSFAKALKNYYEFFYQWPLATFVRTVPWQILFFWVIA